MVFEKISVLNVPLTLVLDECGDEFEHVSGANLGFNGRDVQSYKVEWNGHRELVLMVKRLDADSILRGTWECFFKALSISNDSESFSDLAKGIYAQSFLDILREVNDTLDHLWKMDNKDLVEDNEDDFMASDECYYDLDELDIDG